MAEYANLEIGLHRREPGSYGVEFRYNQPNSEADVRLGNGQPHHAVIDIDALNEIAHDHESYGRKLTEYLFGQSSVQTAYAQARTSAQTLGMPLRMRLMIGSSAQELQSLHWETLLIHVIDAVILPESRTIVDIAVEDGRFTTLVFALTEADLVEALQGEGPFTVFAPTDDAFNSLPDGALDSLVANLNALTNTLLYHVVEGKFMASDVVGLDGQEVATLAVFSVLKKIDNGVFVGEAMVIITDIEASNGAIHVIESVLLLP
jgi:uncharacterized surface protein with fasciclin (FAS1) repeats